MTRVSAILLFLTIAVSCSNDESRPNAPCRVTKMTTEVAGNRITKTYDYNDDFQLKGITIYNVSATGATTSSGYVFTYSNRQISSVLELGGSHTFTWTQENGRVKSVLSSGVINPYAATFTHDENGNMATWDAVYDYGNRVLSQSTMMDAEGNLTSNRKRVTMGVTVSESTNSLSGYDSRRSPYSMLAEAIAQPQYHEPDGEIIYNAVSNNNPTLETYSTSGAPSVAYTLTYVYNEKGFPATITRTNNGQPSDVTKYTFEYNYCN